MIVEIVAFFPLVIVYVGFSAAETLLPAHKIPIPAKNIPVLTSCFPFLFICMPPNLHVTLQQ